MRNINLAIVHDLHIVATYISPRSIVAHYEKMLRISSYISASSGYI